MSADGNGGRSLRQLSEMLGSNCQANHNKEVKDKIDALIGMIEPAIIIVMGVLIGGLVLAMYLPIFNMSMGHNGLNIIGVYAQLDMVHPNCSTGCRVGGYLIHLIYTLPYRMMLEWQAEMIQVINPIILDDAQDKLLTGFRSSYHQKLHLPIYTPL